MEREFEIFRQTRKNFIALTEGLGDEDILTIPDGFNNNILWNLGHVLVTQQLLCYMMTDNPLYVSEELVSMFRKATVPESEGNSDTRKVIIDSLLPMVDKLVEDYQAGLFGEFKEYPTSYGYTLSSIEDAITFNNLHEGLHLGYIMALKRIIGC